MVGKKSILTTGTELIEPGLVVPGARMMVGSRTPPSYSHPFPERKGRLEVGFDADITLVDMEKVKTIVNNDVFSKCGWSAFDGMKVKGWPSKTIVNGKIVYENETIHFSRAGKEVVFNS